MVAKLTCACGKQYSWKPELAGKRAKCKCGQVVAFPAQDPSLPELPPVPEGFEDAATGVDVPPPPPPPPVTPVRGGITDSTGGGGRTGFHFNWRAALTVLGGLAIAAFGVFQYVDITRKEQAGSRVTFRGRKGGIISLLYGIGGKWAVVGLFVLIGGAMVVGGVVVMVGKKKD